MISGLTYYLYRPVELDGWPMTDHEDGVYCVVYWLPKINFSWEDQCSTIANA